ncbi:serine hydrolase [Streptomyces niveus]|uniref:serine hydrolase n=1 Tax=Streptomyces niveus TaxID=193462 RepID=UPI0035DC675D
MNGTDITPTGQLPFPGGEFPHSRDLPHPPDLPDRFELLGARLWLHARCVDCGHAAGHAEDERVVLASVVKVLLVLEFFRQAAAGQLDPAERAVVRAADRLGGTGTAGFHDDVELSLRDLALMTMSVSDNTAADILFRRVGRDTVQALARQLGLERAQVTGGPREVLESMLEDLGAADADAFASAFAALPAEEVHRLRALDPARTTSATPREMTRLLSLVWNDRAGTAAACAGVRELMSLQVNGARLGAAFDRFTTVAAKSGTLPGVRNEIGVVTYPDGARYAIAVFTRTTSLSTRRPDLDTAIGGAGREVVAGLRGCCGPAGRSSPRGD